MSAVEMSVKKTMPPPEAGRDAGQPYELIIESGRAERHYWLDLWRYRELFQVLAWRDIAVRYKQTVIGAAWAIVRPFLTMVVFTIVFGKLAQLPSEGTAPYALMVFAGMLPWSFFATAVDEIIGARRASVVFLPLFAMIAFVASIGIGVWITALNVKYRDFRYIIPFMVQMGLYVSPVGFSSNVIPDQWRLLYSLNPMVGVIDGFRWCLLGGQSQLYWPGLALSVGVAAFFLWFGIRQFRKMEKSFADLI